MSSAIAQRQLANALKQCHKEPIEGFCVELLDDDDLFAWKIYLEGPSDSPYEGGIFQAVMKFPPEFPMLPPSLRFTSDFWHPNVYADGTVCISILHAPGEDAMSGELPEERWLPTQTVGTILLSVISMLNDPNTSSPANVDAGVMWRNERETYIEKCKKLVSKANAEMPEGIEIPHPDTNPEEKQKQLEKMRLANETVDFFDDSEGEDFFPDSGDDQNSINSAFYDTDDGSIVDEAEIWKNEEIMEDSTETEVPEEAKECDVVVLSGDDKEIKVEEKSVSEEAAKEQNEEEVKNPERKQEGQEEDTSASKAAAKEESPSNSIEGKEETKGSGKKKKECAIM